MENYEMVRGYRKVINANMCDHFLYCVEHEDFMIHTEEALMRVAKNIILYSPYKYTHVVFFEFVGKFLAHIGRKENGQDLLSAFVNDILLESASPPDRVTALLAILHGCVVKINELCDDHEFEMRYYDGDNSDTARLDMEAAWYFHVTDLRIFANLIVLVLKTNLSPEFFRDRLHPAQFSIHAINCDLFRLAMRPVWDFLMESNDVNMIKTFWRDIATSWLQIYAPSMSIYEQPNYNENEMFFRMLNALVSVVPEANRGSFAGRLLAKLPHHILNDFHYDKDVIIRICRDLVLNDHKNLHVFQKLRAVNLLACTPKGMDMIRTEFRYHTFKNDFLKDAINLRRNLTYKILPGTSDSTLKEVFTPKLSFIRGIDASRTVHTVGLKNILANTPYLRYVLLRDTNITDDSLKQYSNCWTGIHILDLTNCAFITDESLPLLMQFTSLRLLNIVRTGISGEGYITLKLNLNSFGTRILYAEDPNQPTFE